MTPLEITRLRLTSQQIAGSHCTTPGEVVSWLGAVQAQDYPGALWSVGLRLPGSTSAGIGQAVASKTIVRTWAMRGTLHFVSTSDIRWMLALLAPRIIAGNRRRYRELGLDEQTLARSNAAIAEALQGDRQLDRTALLAILEHNGIPTGGQRAPFMLQRASLDGLVCQGVPRRTIPTYMSLEESLPEAHSMEHDKAVAELAARYFSSRGPATLQDFAGWSGLLVDEARTGLEAIRSQLARETMDGQTWWLPRSARPVQDTSPSAYLLPGFDEYILGYRDRSAILDVLKMKKMILKNGMLTPTIVIDGRIAGTWKRTFRNGTVSIASNPFTPLTAGERDALATAARRYGEFLGMPVVLQ